MSACEICWAEASRKALILGGFTAEYYHAELDAHPEHVAGQDMNQTTNHEIRRHDA